ncbi:helix-turn-helix domain-containing protein [Parashewanella tropica]|uniref:helix-turn-helix domain-containing protein n=1 Tax=Parashewanella tropica TaxID=2547970 RepID=UPI00105A27EB|nr:helix-turn-helix transcriptional regulator [Parashewanella tropica]
MALTDFGKAIRKARIDINYSLRKMATELETSPAYLSCLETGSKKISMDWVKKIDAFLEKKGSKIHNIEMLANVSNETVPLSGLSQQHQMLVAGFASSQFNPEQLKMLADLLHEIEGENA